MKRLVQVRIDAELMKAVDHLKIDWGISRAATIERLLREAIDPARAWGVADETSPRTRPRLATREQMADMAAEVQRGLQPLSGNVGHKRMTI